MGNCWDIVINGQQLAQPTLGKEGYHCQKPTMVVAPTIDKMV